MSNPYRDVETFDALVTNAGGEADLMTVDSDLDRKRGMVFFVTSDQDGDSKVYEVMPSGTRMLLDTIAVTSANPGVHDFDYRLPRAVLTFTPSGTDANVEALGVDY